ncbi:unnamed protein product, partial [Prorocentrum cordatum]
RPPPRRPPGLGGCPVCCSIWAPARCLAQVVFGEYCEMGACCLKWEEGPPLIWQAALDRALERAPGEARRPALQCD